MKLYNTLSRQTEEFSAADGSVKMYVCGITPYSPSHVGHAFSSVVFDTLRRYLEYSGSSVRHVQNFTDIDDKMIKAAVDEGISVAELAERNIHQYYQEIDALNVLRAHVYPRATGEIPKIIEITESLIAAGYAYAVDGSVYYRVNNFDGYGKLSRRSLDSMQAGARVEVDENKEDVMDFALWKAQKPGEPSWDSPWGPGRPGWHIECSAMSIAHLGETIDIHGGGPELMFPHHENEIAQSEPYTGKAPFVRFWVHHGHVQFGEDKMSKSLGNVVPIGEALERYSPDALRLFFLSSHYRSPLVYSDQNVTAQERAFERLKNALRAVDGTGSALDGQTYLSRFVEAMDDDLNTPRALAALFDLARDINRTSEAGGGVSDAQQLLSDLCGVLGITLEGPATTGSGDVAPFVELLVNLRSELRGAKQFELADRVRDGLSDLGVSIEDKAGGTEWRQTT
ncbi:MAG: cysteine--tRNA ligase [Chloroflexi bacterium]|nr:cysteine--tRNA ligase [Chloroflexota bacterium]